MTSGTFSTTLFPISERKEPGQAFKGLQSWRPDTLGAHTAAHREVSPLLRGNCGQVTIRAGSHLICAP